ncbi:hypothetical protein EUBHAL_02232 [Anaerobutyricum hallii DSM 3353]|uniref:Uncharacterized protein n=1 Tax=Anaerobutyricum hallii DSM 3353 TaxID=411469 RepID=C0EXT9_9FIRM|nr:hypothetical protein EUBHAL_02232 [Anaerobutyricum hallii DSM 3353]
MTKHGIINIMRYLRMANTPVLFYNSIFDEKQNVKILICEAAEQTNS